MVELREYLDLFYRYFLKNFIFNSIKSSERVFYTINLFLLNNITHRKDVVNVCSNQRIII